MDKILRPPWNLRDCLLILAGMAVAAYGISWGLRLKEVILPLKYQFLLISFIQAGVVFAGLYYFVRLRYRSSVAALGLEKGAPWVRHFLSGLGGGVLLFLLIIFTGLLVQIWVTYIPAPQPFARLVLEAKNTRELILPFFLASFLAPASEEAYFRGFLYPVLRSRWGLKPALLLNGAIFGSLHFDPVRFLPLALGGAGLAWLYEKSGSLLTPFVAHAVWNTIMLFLLYFSLR